MKTALKVFAWMVWLAFGAVVIITVLDMLDSYYMGMSFMIVIAYGMAGGIIGTLLYAASIHLEHQEEIISALHKLNVSSLPKTAVNTEENEWICPKCGQKNPSASISCRDCGTYK